MSPSSNITPEHAVALLKQIHEVTDIVFREVAEILAEFDLTQPQATMLWVLDPSTPPVSMRELARQLHYDPSNVTLLGDQLQTAGLVKRQPDPTDGRRRVLILTDQGLEVWSRLLERIVQRSPLFTLSLKDQKQLLGLLEKVQTNNAQMPTGFLT
jgi:MarR family transcriptional regulator, organic hydroperoxide resistance regulator